MKKGFEEYRRASDISAFLTVIYLAIEYYWRVQVVGGVRRNKGEAGGYVLQLGAASHCGVGILTAQLHFAAGCCVSLWSW